MDIDGRHCIDEEKQLRRLNFAGSRSLLLRLREIHGTAVPQPEPDIVELVPVIVRKSEPLGTKAETRFVRYLTDENGRRIPMVSEIKRIVAQHFEVTPVNLDSRSRKARFVWPRQIAMFLCHTITLRSLPDIGRRFGGRDHTTVLHAVRKIERLVASSPETEALVNELKEELNDDHCSTVPSDETAAPAHEAAL